MVNINKLILVCVFLVFGIALQASAQFQNDDVWEYPALSQQNYRYYLNIPNIEGYETLKCDFHVHTVFSDGQVWPAMRVDEAWNEGLDVIAITDHIEYRPNKAIVVSDLNKSYEIAKKKGDAIGLIVVKGIEITRKKPFGHMNALFIQDANKIDLPNELDALNEAVKQGAFILWNHPGWPNDTSTIYPIHEELIGQKKIHGVEVFNSNESYPKVMDWFPKYKLAPFANTDIHYTTSNMYRGKGQRPMTLVFVKERSEEGVKEALFAGRTVAFYGNELVGNEEYLKELVQKSLSIKVIDEKKGGIEICNKSDITFSIKWGNKMYSTPVLANQIVRVGLPSGTPVIFTNCLTGKDQFLTMKLW